MRFTTPNEIESLAWEGELESSAVSFGFRSVRPVVSLGRPEVWPAEQALESETGKKWTPPLGEARYWLVRLACTLHQPPTGQGFTAATQTLFLSPQPHSAGEGSAYAKDLFPQRLGVEDKSSFTFSLGPELGFASGASIKAGEVGATFDYTKVFPVIQAYGAGESAPYWVFQPHAAYPLLGSQFVYAVLAARAPATGLRAHVEVSVKVQSAFGPIKYGTPEEARQQTEIVLP